MIPRYTPDDRPLANPRGINRDKTMFRWLMRAVTLKPHPIRGAVNSRTGKVHFLYRWKGGR